MIHGTEGAGRYLNTSSGGRQHLNFAPTGLVSKRQRAALHKQTKIRKKQNSKLDIIDLNRFDFLPESQFVKKVEVQFSVLVLRM